MKRLYQILILVVLTALLATPILAAGYVIQINVVESAGNSYTRLPMIATLNNTYLASSGLIASNALDTRVINSANVTLPHLVADNKTLFVDNITASSTSVFQYKSGQSVLDSMPIVVGQGGYITTLDAAKLEPSDNFSLTVSGYLLMSGSGDIFKKLNALRLSYSGTTLTLKAGDDATPDITLTATGVAAGEHAITISVAFVTGSGGSVLFSPTGNGDFSQLSVAPTGAQHWQSAASTDHADNLNNVYNDSPPSISKKDLYTFTFGTPAGFSALQIRLWGKSSYYSGGFVPMIKSSGGTIYYATSKIVGYGGWREETWLFDTNPITGLAWDVADLTGIQFGATINTGSFGWWRMNGYQVELLDASAEYVPTLQLYVDDTLVDSEEMDAPIPDNASDWVWYPNPYFNYVKLETVN